MDQIQNLYGVQRFWLDSEYDFNHMLDFNSYRRSRQVCRLSNGYYKFGNRTYGSLAVMSFMMSYSINTFDVSWK